MIDHNFVINIIIKNKGIIIGGYVREWLANGVPSDNGWKDIDIKCQKKDSIIIEKEIKIKYPKLQLDFSPNMYDSYRNLYSCNLIKYDGEFKPCINSNYDILNLTKNKICIYLNNSNAGRVLSFEKKIINNGWKIEYPNIFDKEIKF